jgi:hypothetical protein
MPHGSSLSTVEILAVFSDEIVARSGQVLDVFDDSRRLFDRLQGGVALRTIDSQVWVHPYVFRQVCKNGAIMPQTLGTRHVTAIEAVGGDDALESVRDAVVACCADQAFSTAVGHMRSAMESEADLVLSLLPHLARFSSREHSSLVSQILERFLGGGDNSRLGLMNAVTSLARDTRDPETRWRLEELGGGIPAAILPVHDDSGGHAERFADVFAGCTG